MTRARPRTLAPAVRSLVVACASMTALLGCPASGALPADTGAGGGRGTGTQSSSGGEGGFNPSGGGGGDSVGGGKGCVTSSVEAARLPLNMFIAIDTSASMGEPSDPGDINSLSKWAVVQQSFTQFFADPSAADLRVALRFWPDKGCDSTLDPSCADAIPFCQQPEVAVGPLSDMAQRSALVQALLDHSPNGGTPTSAALSGATRWCADIMVKKNKMEKAVVLLVTDGQPTSCDMSIADIAHIADAAYQGSGVLTYAVGLAGSNQATMDQIAAGGHTGAGFMIAPGNMTAHALLTALQKIRGGALSCAFKIPEAPAGQTLDPTQVNVEYTLSGGAKVELTQAKSAAACGLTGGWYYDNDKSPTSITLCPATCSTVQADSAAKVKIVLGCATRVP